MNWTLFLLDDKADRYFCGLEVIRFYMTGANVDIEFESENGDNTGIATIICNNGDGKEAYDRICESMMKHPGVIDLRNLSVISIEEK